MGKNIVRARRQGEGLQMLFSECGMVIAAMKLQQLYLPALSLSIVSQKLEREFTFPWGTINC